MLMSPLKMPLVWLLFLILGMGPAKALHSVPVHRSGEGNEAGPLLVEHNPNDAEFFTESGKDKPYMEYMCHGQKLEPHHVENRSARKRNLTFVHIPRCAGTSIEDCSRNDMENLRWGHLNPQLTEFHHFPKPADKNNHIPRSCYKHHVPPTQMQQFYKGKTTFCVVRDPYERMISEFHYPLTKGFGKMVREGKCNAQGLNEFLFEKMNLTAKNPYMCDCHMLPQAAFVYGWDEKRFVVDRASKSCNFVIRFEHLEKDFNKFMADNGYEYRLTKNRNQRLIPSPQDGCGKLTAHDFSPAARKEINRLWKEDFELLGYTMIE